MMEARKPSDASHESVADAERTLPMRPTSLPSTEDRELSEHRLRLALDAVNIGTWDFNPVTGTLQWDTRCKELFGLPPEVEVNYETFLQGLHPDDRERTDQTVQQALDPAGSDTYDIEYRTL